MNKDELRAAILDAIDEYIASEETFGDTALLSIKPIDLSVSIIDGEELAEADMQNSGIDYYDIIDFIQMNTDSGQWNPNSSSVDDILNEYVK